MAEQTINKRQKKVERRFKEGRHNPKKDKWAKRPRHFKQRKIMRKEIIEDIVEEIKEIEAEKVIPIKKSFWQRLKKYNVD